MSEPCYNTVVFKKKSCENVIARAMSPPTGLGMKSVIKLVKSKLAIYRSNDQLLSSSNYNDEN